MVAHPDPTPDTRAWVETAATFYRRERPDAHFRTSSSTSALFADAVVGLLAEHPAIDAVVEVGAGTGTLLTHLHHRRPDLRLTGIDLRSRPPGLAPDVGWAVDHWVGVRGAGAVAAPARPGAPSRGPVRSGWQEGTADAVFAQLTGPTLVLACEFLDDLPLVPGRPGGGRVEAWADLVRALHRPGGLALLVDYVAEPGREAPLLGYRDGQAVDPVVAADRNLTAALDLDAVVAEGEAAGARTRARLPQSAALGRWLPAQEQASGQADPLAELVARSERYALGSPGWLGDHWWLLQEVAGGERRARRDRPDRHPGLR